MKITNFIITSVFLLLAAFCCTNTNESQQVAVKEPHIKADSAFVSQSLAFAEEHKWVSFTLSRARYNTYFWNDLYRFHNISFENKQPYIDSILMDNI